MRANQAKLVNIAALSDHKGIPVRTLRSLMAARKIPFLKFGHRTIFFDPDEVDKALQRFQVQEVGSRSRRGVAK
jgi:ribosome-binding factor A